MDIDKNGEERLRIEADSYASPGDLSSIATPRPRTRFAMVSPRSRMIHGRLISTRTTSRTSIRPVIRCHIADGAKFRVSPSQR